MNQFKFDGNWEYEIQIPAFEQIQSIYTDGRIILNITDDLSETPDPYQSQLQAINFILENQFVIADKIIERTVAELPKIFENYYGLSQKGPYMLEFEDKVIDLGDLSYDNVVNLIGIQSITILIPSKNQSSYYDITGRCAWDEEHGLNYLMHEDRILTMGAIEGNSFWDAIKDNGTYDEHQEIKKTRSVPKKYEPNAKYNKLKPSHKNANDNYEYSIISGGYNTLFMNLVEEGELDFNGINENHNKSFLEIACWFNNNELVEYLLNKGAKIRYALHQCIGYNDNPEAFEMILKSGGDINKQDGIGNTILITKAYELSRCYDSKTNSINSRQGNQNEFDQKINALKKEVKNLIRRGCDPNIKNNYGSSAYSTARNLSPHFRKEMQSFIKSCDRLFKYRRLKWKFWK